MLSRLKTWYWERTLQCCSSVAHIQKKLGAGTEITFFCFHPSCGGCREYAASQEKRETESKFDSHVIPWDCANERKKDIAQDAGVTQLPCYVIIPARGIANVICVQV